MDKDLIYAGYGFDIESIDGTPIKYRKNKYEVEIFYYNDSTNESLLLTYEFNCKGILKALTKYKEISNKFKNYRICQTIAFIINNSNFGSMNYFDGDDFEADYLDSIPNSLIINDEAMRELLSNLNQDNKHLVVYVGEYIKDRRKRIEEEKQAYLEENKETFDKYDQLKEEFKF